MRRGEVRKPYFARYAERPHPCSAETIAHEITKLKLVALLLAGTHSIGLRLPCRVCTDTLKDNQDCPDEVQLEQSREVLPFDHASVEVSFQTYRLDAAATLTGRVVLGLEVARAKSPGSAGGLTFGDP